MNKIQLNQLGYAMKIIELKKIRTQRYDEIIYIQYDKPYVRINTITKGNYLIYTNLSDLKEFLPEYFFQINKSTIVSLKCVKSIMIIKSQFIVTVGDDGFTISRRRYRLAFESFMKYSFPSSTISNNTV